MQTINLAYLRFLTDDFGIWQHSAGLEIDKQHGYALDDAARALLLALETEQLDLATIYLNFIEHACCHFPEPINFFSPLREPVAHPISPDALGESYWALATAVQANFEVERVRIVLARLTPLLSDYQWSRTQAYTLLGAQIVDQPLAHKLSTALVTEFRHFASAAWPWPEDQLRYGNAILPLALLTSGHLAEALVMLNFLNETCTLNGTPIAIGNDGWYRKDGTKSLYAQQPIDPAYQVLANVEAFKITGDVNYNEQAERYLSWFWGNNIAGQSLIDTAQQRCLDGIDRNGVSGNAGAESTVCYLLAQHSYIKYCYTDANDQGHQSRRPPATDHP